MGWFVAACEMRLPLEKRNAKNSIRNTRTASLLRGGHAARTYRFEVAVSRRVKGACQGGRIVLWAESFARLPGSGRSIGTIQQPKAGSYNLRLFRTILHRGKKLSAPRERLPAEYQLGRRASCGVCPLSVFRGACVCA